MNPEARLAQILDALEAVGLRCLVMGGHAVRYYGFERNTLDFDLHLAPECWDALPARLAQTSLAAAQALIEGPSWRPDAFRRFQIGTLPSGREEWLEFWRENHLLAPYADLFARHEAGLYGGRLVRFLALPDLIHSKETERESDWQDIAVLEEFLDTRLLARAAADPQTVSGSLAQLRSRRGLERALQQGLLRDPAQVEQALAQAPQSISQALLLPCAPRLANLPPVPVPIEPIVRQRLGSTPPGSSLHLALVELVRRQYKMAAQAADRADKEAIRKRQGTGSGPTS